VHLTDGSDNPIDVLLADAQILTDYDRSHAPTAAERIARAAARNRPDLVVCHATHSAQDERIRGELDLICAQVLSTPQAAASLTSLSQLGDTRHVEPEGALVFACLLHLIGREEGALFWWKFAAGGEIHTAARCLALHCQSNADFAIADLWREQADDLLVQQQGEGDPKPALPAPQPLLPDHIARRLLEQCRCGVQPRLPAAWEDAVNRLVIEYDDADYGECPQPSPQLPYALGTHG
jgi:hypothetical protein